MKYDLHLFFAMIGVGLVTKKVGTKGWLLIAGLVMIWVFYNWKKG